MSVQAKHPVRAIPAGTPQVRDTRTGASASAMLFTVLGEFLFQSDQAVWTGTLLSLLADLGFSEGAARRAISRTATRGWLVPHRQGRATRWSLSESAGRHFAAAAVEIYQRRRADEPWTGDWLLVAKSIPESQRALRHRLRVGLRWAGLGPLGQGLWVTPRVAVGERVRALLDELGLASTAVTFVGRVDSVGGADAVVREAWDLATLSRDYEQFVTRNERVPREGSPRETFTRLTRIVHDWRSFALRDPMLPPALLPPDWAGFAARALFYDLHDEWLPIATKWLRSLDRSLGARA